MDALDYLSHCAARLDPHLAAQAPADGAPQVLYEAMRHLLVPGGKRLRPGFAFAACEAAGAPPERALPAALAVELLHTYSLIHDDLPCMDNSPTRRGAPSVHARFGEAVALLAGDALQALAFEALARAATADAGGAAGAGGAADMQSGADSADANSVGANSADAAQRAAALGALRDLATAAGPRNLVGGQCDDLAFAGVIGDAPAVAFGAATTPAPASSNAPNTPDAPADESGAPGEAAAEAAAVESVHLRKSAALIAAALTAGARLGGAGPELVARLRGFGEQVGVAFQIVDDLLDHAQENPEPCSLARVLGAPAARKRAESLLESALKRIADLGPEADALRALARYALQRER